MTTMATKISTTPAMSTVLCGHQTSTSTTLRIQITPMIIRMMREEHHGDPDEALPEQRDVLVVDVEHPQEDDDRQRDEDDRGEPTLGRQRAHVTEERLSLPQRRRGRSQRLAEVATDLALDLDGHGRPAHVLAVHPVGHPLERFLDVGADARLRHGPGELLGGRLRHVVSDRVEGLRQGESGREAAGDEGEHVGQLPLELAGPAPGEVLQHHRRHDEPDDDAQEGPEEGQQAVAVDEQDAQQQPDDDRDDAKDRPLPRPPGQVGALQKLHGPRGRLTTLDDAVTELDELIGDAADVRRADGLDGPTAGLRRRTARSTRPARAAST